MLLNRRKKKLKQALPSGKYLSLLRPRERYTILGWDDELVKKAQFRQKKNLEQLKKSQSFTQNNPLYLSQSPSTPTIPLDYEPEIKHETTTKFKPLSSNLINFKFQKLQNIKKQAISQVLDERKLMLKRKFVRLYQETVMKIPIEQEIRCNVKELWELADTKQLPETKWLGLISVFIDQNTKFLNYKKRNKSRSKSRQRGRSRGKWFKNSLVSRSFSSMSTKSVNLKMKKSIQNPGFEEYGTPQLKFKRSKPMMQSQISPQFMKAGSPTLKGHQRNKSVGWDKPKTGSSLRSIVEKVQIEAKEEYMRKTLNDEDKEFHVKKPVMNVTTYRNSSSDTNEISQIKPQKQHSSYKMTPQWPHLRSSQVEVDKQRAIQNRSQPQLYSTTLENNLSKRGSIRGSIQHTKQIITRRQSIKRQVTPERKINPPPVQQTPTPHRTTKSMMFKDQYGNLYSTENKNYKLIERNGRQYLLMKKRDVKGPSRSPTPEKQRPKIETSNRLSSIKKSDNMRTSTNQSQMNRSSIFESHQKSRTPTSMANNHLKIQNHPVSKMTIQHKNKWKSKLVPQSYVSHTIPNEPSLLMPLDNSHNSNSRSGSLSKGGQKQIRKVSSFTNFNNGYKYDTQSQKVSVGNRENPYFTEYQFNRKIHLPTSSRVVESVKKRHITESNSKSGHRDSNIVKHLNFFN